MKNIQASKINLNLSHVLPNWLQDRALHQFSQLISLGYEAGVAHIQVLQQGFRKGTSISRLYCKKNRVIDQLNAF